VGEGKRHQIVQIKEGLGLYYEPSSAWKCPECVPIMAGDILTRFAADINLLVLRNMCCNWEALGRRQNKLMAFSYFSSWVLIKRSLGRCWLQFKFKASGTHTNGSFEVKKVFFSSALWFLIVKYSFPSPGLLPSCALANLKEQADSSSKSYFKVELL
jgi:hypothetical protein